MNPASAAQFALLFPGDSELAARMRELDWARTPIGAPGSWPQHLRVAIGICLMSRFPMQVWWGPSLTMFYNDAYIPFLGAAKHPAALGHSAQHAWAEIWSTIGPMIDGVFTRAESSWSEDIRMHFDRAVPEEEVFVTFSFSPVFDADGTVGGVFCACTETTDKIVGERRLDTLRALGVAAHMAQAAGAACRAAAAALAANPRDVPLAAIYLAEPGGHARLAVSSGVGNAAAIPPQLPLDAAALAELSRGLAGSALLLPMASGGSEHPAGVLLAAVSPHRPLDAAYRAFLDLVAGHIGAAIADARAFEQQRERAEALAELDRAKTAFFSNVSHELRTPLTLLLAPIDDLLAEPGSDATRERLQLARRNGRRLLNLVNTLLDFSRIEAGRVQAEPEPLDLAAATADVTSMFGSAFERAGVRLVIDCPPLPRAACVDREMWERVVLNLVSNALKYTLEGEVRVALRADGDAALLSVADSGAGIPEAALPKLFERFYRVEGTAGRSQEGSGIGLALVRELVRLHGGSVGVDSRHGAGSTFSVRIPFGNAAPAAPGGRRRSGLSSSSNVETALEESSQWLRDTGWGGLGDSEDAAASAAPAGGRSRSAVLVADDNADMRGYLRRLLERDYEVWTAGDGVQALRLARERRPDLVLSDVMMPALDGFALLRALRDDPRTASLPVILLSARAGDEARIEGLQAGADDYLTKPFNARELLARIAGTLLLAAARREAGEALQASEQRLRIALDTARLGAWELDLASQALQCTVQCKANFGLAADDELSYARLFELIHADDRPRVRRLVAGAIERGTDYDAEYRVLTPAGDERVIIARGRALYDAGGRPQRMVGATLDVTERRRAEDALRAGEARSRFRVELDEVLRRLVEPAEIMHTAARMLCDQLGAERCIYGEIDADDAHFIASGDYAPGLPSIAGRFRLGRFGAALVAAYHAGEPFVFDDVEADARVAADRPAYRAIGARAHLGAPLHKDGRFVAAMALVQGQPRQWTVAEIQLARSVVARCWEAVDRARAERRLAASEERFRTLADAMPQIVYVTDAAGRLEFVNRQWSDFTGRATVNVTDPGLIHADDIDNLKRRWADALAGGKPLVAEFRLRRSDGQYRWFLTRALPSRDGAGGITRWYGTSTEIERQKRSQQALRDADRLKDEFLATLAHELRNPLAPLRNATQILRRTATPEATARVHAMMDRQIDHLVRLVDDLLEVSRITRGKIELQRAPVSLDSVLEAAIETSRPLIEAAGHALDLQRCGPDWQLDGDPVRLAQVFANLLNNAAKYTDAGGRIAIVCRRDGDSAEVTVRDNGIGIAPAHLPLVFELFTQPHAGGLRAQGGLGIGLSLVRSLVGMHGGEVEARSEGVGRGSEFVVRLPLLRQLPASGAAAPAPAPAAAGVRERSVLVVDDNTDAADSLGLLLQVLGATVQVAHDGEAALAALDRHRPQTVLLDLGMPGMDGFEVARRMRAKQGGAALTLIALTGWGQPQDRERTRAAGFDHHLVKPVDIDVLQALLQQTVPVL